ncbi:hypothetical protein RISK_006444 [Rhodopirellula islandica]|uniref:Uncharacterized protein n=1 Tax=Rhodopirellula islandica TaxID=595434 RepID=A0A0J1B3V0_RHOIS|nr:hypothetical protein RISK_006444 [Rhodopirellula islandica]
MKLALSLAHERACLKTQMRTEFMLGILRERFGNVVPERME